MLGLTPLLQALNASVRLGSTSRRKAEPQLWGLGGTSKPGNQAMATSFFRSAARRGLAWASSMGSPLNVCLPEVPELLWGMETLRLSPAKGPRRDCQHHVAHRATGDGDACEVVGLIPAQVVDMRQPPKAPARLGS